MGKLLYFCAFLAFLRSTLCEKKADFLSEELYVRPLIKTNQILTHFQFQTESVKTSPPQHMNYGKVFPKVIGQLCEKYHILNFSLSFSVGQWDPSKWGEMFPSQAPFGAQIQVQIQNDDDKGWHRWKGFRKELAGIFSISLGKVDVAFQPPNPSFLNNDYLYQKEFVNVKKDNSTVFLQANLPREEFCTENLTPWLKLLPCRTHAGFGSLINPIQILNGHYNSISISVSRILSDIDKPLFKLKQTLTTVHSADFLERHSIATLLGRNSYSASQINMMAKCALSTKSRVYVDVPSIKWLAFNPDFVLENPDYGVIGVKELSFQPIDISKLLWKAISEVELVQLKSSYMPRGAASSMLSVHRFLTGFGQVRGGLSVQFRNKDTKNSASLAYYDAIPWFLRLYFYTAKLSLNGQILDKEKDLVYYNVYPAEDHGHPNLIEFLVTIPPMSVLTFSIQYEKAFLPLKEHPPDGNRGFDISSAIATFYHNRRLNKKITVNEENMTRTELTRFLQNPTRSSIRIYTEPLLAPLPTPDFSMPYNVITLTCTVVAFFLGTILNTLLRRRTPSRLDLAKLEKESAEAGSESFVSRLKNKLFRFRKAKQE